MNPVSDKPSGASADQGKPGTQETDGLGNFLKATRERRGLSRDDVVKQTRIPGNYLQMLEGSDYSMISDQLYLMPFLRRYASFLQLDPEEIAMRFVREVQRAENTQPITRTADPLLDDSPSRYRRWIAAVVIVLVVALAIWIYSIESKRLGANAVPQAPATVSSPSSAVPLSPGPVTESPTPGAAGSPNVSGQAKQESGNGRSH